LTHNGRPGAVQRSVETTAHCRGPDGLVGWKPCAKSALIGETVWHMDLTAHECQGSGKVISQAEHRLAAIAFAKSPAY